MIDTKNRMLRKVAPLDTTSLTKTDDSSYDNISEFINEQCKNYGDELASKFDFESISHFQRVSDLSVECIFRITRFL